jgi:type 1 glutamine amidotransferase
MKSLTLAAAALLSITATSFSQTPIKVLFWGGPGGGAHNVPAFKDSILPVLTGQGMVVTYRQEQPYPWLHADSLAQYDVILAYTTNQNANQLTQGQLTALTTWISSGRVFVALHGTTNTFINNSAPITAAWRALLGATYTGHGPLNTSGTVTRTTAGTAHSCLQGTTMLPASAANTGESPYWDEGREHINYSSDTLVLARSQTASSNFPWIWLRPQGLGWVYYNASGHDGQVWTRAEFKGQVIRALQWGASVKTTGIRGKAAIEALVRAEGHQLQVPGIGSHSLRILDMAGKSVLVRKDSRASHHDLSGLPLGVYALEVLTRTDAYRGVFVRKP